MEEAAQEPLETFSARISFIALAMCQEEGFFGKNNLSRRNNNPGNLRSWPSIRSVGGYAVFDTALSGYVALLEDIRTNKNLTIRNFLFKFSPPNENNTNSYIDLVCSLTGFQPDEVMDGE